MNKQKKSFDLRAQGKEVSRNKLLTKIQANYKEHAPLSVGSRDLGSYTQIEKFYLDQEKWRPAHLEDINNKWLGSIRILPAWMIEWVKVRIRLMGYSTGQPNTFKNEKCSQ